jgi:hypothetical protein
MRRRSVLLLAVLLALAAAAPSPAADGDERLHGEFTSDYHDGKKSLEATFTPTGDQQWDVVFRFDWDGRRTYSGVAAGSVVEGTLEGRATDEGGRRVFTFRGEFAGGLFEGTHYELNRRGRETRTGTLVLRR